MNPRICMICSQFYPVVGGTERQAENLAIELKKKGYSVFILTQRIKGIENKEVKDGITIYRKIVAPHLGLLFGISYIISVFLFLWGKRKQYDIIHCHIFYLHTISAVIIGKLFQKKVIVKLACTSDFGEIQTMQKEKKADFLLKIYRKADIFVSVSQEGIKELKNIGIPESKIIYIPNSIDTSKLFPVSDIEKIELKEKLFLDKEKKIVSFVGRLNLQKGVEYLLYAWQKVIKEYPQSLLLIIGDGPERKNLEQLSNGLKIKDTNIIFMGIKRNISDYLQASNIFVLPSLSEGLSGALLEAMACGLPCIVTRIGGNIDLIEDRVSGLFVEQANVADLAEKIKYLSGNPRLEPLLGKNARLNVEKKFSLPIFVEEYIQLYKNLIK
ncbi:MAG: glycosyltransferase family 4 protein [bacterium]